MKKEIISFKILPEERKSRIGEQKSLSDLSLFASIFVYLDLESTLGFGVVMVSFEKNNMAKRIVREEEKVTYILIEEEE